MPRLAIWGNRGEEEETARLAGARMRAVVEEAPTAMAILDDRGRFLFANAACYDLLGYDRDALETASIWDLTHPEDLGEEQAVVAELLAGERRRYRVEKRCRRGDGTQVWVCASGFAFGEDGLYAAVLEDIQERKGAEAKVGMTAAALTMQFESMRSLTSQATLADGVPRLLETLCQAGLWDVGTFWQIDRAEDVARCAWIHAAPEVSLPQFVALHDSLISPRGSGLVGRVWQDRSPLWMTNVGQQDAVGRALKASREGVRTGVAVPVLLKGEVRGVLELFSRETRPSNASVVQALVGVSEQLTRFFERDDAAARVAASDGRYERLARIAAEAIISIDQEGRILDANPAAATLFGYGADDLVGQPLTVIMPENLREPHRAGLRRYLSDGQRHIHWDHQHLPGLRRDGSPLQLDISLHEYVRDGVRSFTGLIRDVTEHAEEESELERQSLHDALTGLPNRALLQERLRRAIKVAQGEQTTAALLVMDLDRFKEINDTFGHQEGDAVLTEVANRIMPHLSASDTLARLGGDEFAALLPGGDEGAAMQAADRIVEAVGKSFVLDGRSFNLSAGIGIALYPEHGADPAALMRHAERALYAAKGSGERRAAPRPGPESADSARLRLADELGEAIAQNQLVVYYQPKVNLSDGRTETVECLIRWIHPQRGFTSPDTFIPIAEESGLITALTSWTLSEAIKQHKSWQRMGQQIRVAVNFSPRILADPTLVDMVSDILQRHEVQPSFLQAEITESAMMGNPERNLESLRALRNLGVWASIDDFGVGQSSLTYLRRVPADELKIDRSFVLDMANSQDDASIVQSVISLGHNLGLRVVAEGVDNQRSLDILVSMGCDLGQGFFLSRPIPGPDLTAWLQGPPLQLGRP